MSDIDEGTPPERTSAGWTTGKSVAIPQPAITVDMPLGGQRIQRFLDELGSDAPTPGGGAWAGISAAAGAALIVMVARLTLKKKGFEDVAGRMRPVSRSFQQAHGSYREVIGVIVIRRRGSAGIEIVTGDHRWHGVGVRLAREMSRGREVSDLAVPSRQRVVGDGTDHRLDESVVAVLG